jgi:hypothetical protein
MSKKIKTDLPQLKHLRTTLFKKITEEWPEKWSINHGENVPNVSELYKKNAFLEDLLLDVEDVLRKTLGFDRATLLLISKDSLRRIMNDSYEAKMHEKTRKALAIYLGYKDWQDFVTQHSNENKGLNS